MENPNIPDCTSCKLVGAGGCFAGAAYALYERSRLPPGGKNRVWLSVIGVGKSCNFFVNFNIDTSKNMYAKQLQTNQLAYSNGMHPQRGQGQQSILSAETRNIFSSSYRQNDHWYILFLPRNETWLRIVTMTVI
jgi:hypothetical protein